MEENIDNNIKEQNKHMSRKKKKKSSSYLSPHLCSDWDRKEPLLGTVFPPLFPMINIIQQSRLTNQSSFNLNH